MIVTPIGMTQLYICEDTANCAVKNIMEDNVHQVAEFVDSMNYVVTHIAGSQKAAENLHFYTAGEIVSIQDIDLYIGKFS